MDDEIAKSTLDKHEQFDENDLQKATIIIRKQLKTIKNTMHPIPSSAQKNTLDMTTGNDLVFLPIVDGEAAGVVCIFACVTGLFVGTAASFAQIVDIGLGLFHDLGHTALRISNKWDQHNKENDNGKFMRPLLIRRTDPMDTKVQAQWRAQMIAQIDPPGDALEGAMTPQS